MDEDIELVSDGDGVAVLGDPAAVEQFLWSAGVVSKDLPLKRKLGAAMGAAGGMAQSASQIAENSGRWVKLTEESAKALKLGKAMKGSSDGLSRAIATTNKGKITKILEFTKPGSIGSMLTNPAVLAGAAGVMAQYAMQQTMEEITDYLKVIDEKVDDVLRAQKDAALAEIIGVGMVMDDAMLKREHVGRVSEVTWSSLHGAAQVIATTQAYALRQLDALAEKMDKKARVGELDKFTGAAATTVEEWLAVLARCFQLQDGLAVLELDRVLDSSPDELDRHRSAIRAARDRRRDLIAKSTVGLLARMDGAVTGANDQVLFHPIKAGRVVRAGNEVAADVVLFHERLGIEDRRSAIETRRWREAVGDARDDAVQAGARGVDAVQRLGATAIKGAGSVGARIGDEVVKRLQPGRKRKGDQGGNT